MAPAYKRKRSGSVYFLRISPSRASSGRRRKTSSTPEYTVTTRSAAAGRNSLTCCRVTSDTAMIAAALEAYRGTRKRWLRRSILRDAQGITYQSSPWHTHTAGHLAASGIEYFGL